LLVRENGAFDPQNSFDTTFFLPLTETCLPASLPIGALLAQGAPPVSSPGGFGRAVRRKTASKPRHLITPYPGEIIRDGIDKLHRFVISRANFSVWYA
jgi:hypothetical protein